MTSELTSPTIVGDDEVLLGDILEEITRRVQTGERVDVEEFVRRHPAHEQRIRRMAASLSALGDLARSSPGIADGQPVGGTLGDFRIVREIGRGGMGVVYEAEQISIGRRVALKVLPFAAMLDPKQLQRFKNEVHAAGQLHHTNIVPIYAVGCERGVHYFAMQCIDGQTLAETIGELRRLTGVEKSPGAQAPAAVSVTTSLVVGQGPAASSRDSGKQVQAAGDTAKNGSATAASRPSISTHTYFRSVARLGIQAAEALEHAHQVGVVHRDVKPANLMVDASGKVWVADFGLARVAGESQLTMTGDVVGTLRYMSPEQALGRRTTVDHRTDVYSLGTTLYELLTLEPAIAGKDRQEVLRHIALEEPKPPRRLNRSVPPELETIVLKAMAKIPEERYASAQELAGDLQCFLDDRPIRARRPSLVVILRKWGRRHQPAVVIACIAVAVLLLVSLAGLISANWLISREVTAKTKALVAEKRINDTLVQALYRHRIARAHHEWQANNVGHAIDLLTECPPELRRWEWHYLWRLCHGEDRLLRGHSDKVLGLALSHDGKHLATSSIDGVVCLWYAETWGLIRSFRPHKLPVEGIAFSPDGTILATGSRDGTVKRWKTETGELLDVFSHPDSEIHRIDYSRSQHAVAVGTSSGLILWSPEQPQVHRVRKLSAQSVFNVAFSPSGGEVVEANELFGLTAWDVSAAKKVWEQPTIQAYCTAFSADGRHLAIGSMDKTVAVWDSATRSVRWSVRGHEDFVRCVAFSPDGSWLASCSQDQTIKLWDVAAGCEVRTFRGHTGPVTRVAFHPSQEYLVSTSHDGTVRCWQYASDQTARVVPLPKQFASPGFVFRTPGLAAMAASSTFRIHDQELLVIPDLRPMGDLFTSDGKLVACRSAQSIDLKDTTNGTVIQSFPTERGSEIIAVDDLGKRLATVDRQQSVRCWEVATGQIVFAWDPPVAVPATNQSIALSGDGRLLAWCPREGPVQAWDIEAHRPLVHEQFVCRCLAFSHGRRTLACGGDDRSILLIDVTSGKTRFELSGHSAAVTDVAFSTDDQRLASASLDQTVRIWDVTSGDELLVLRGHESEVWGVRFSQDGGLLGTWGRNGVLRVWDGVPLPDRDRGQESSVRSQRLETNEPIAP